MARKIMVCLLALCTASASFAENGESSTEEAKLQWDANLAGYAGNGCPQESEVSIAYTAQSQTTGALTVSIPELTPDFQGSLTDQRQNCRIIVELSCPADVEFSLSRVDYNVAADLDSGVSAVIRAEQYIQGEETVSVSEMELNGPLSEVIRERDQLEKVWWSCDRALNLGLSARVTASGTPAASSVTLRSPVKYQVNLRRVR